jgi:hypothetical protein
MFNVIRSIQQVSISLASGVTSNTASISSVTPGNCMLIFQGNTANIGTVTRPDSASPRVELTNSTTVTATRGASHSDTCTAKAVVVEFASGAMVSATQAGTISLNGVTSNTATIAPVSANAFVLFLGVTSATTNIHFGAVASGVRLTNSTTVTAFTGAASANLTIGYMVVDLPSTIIASVQPRSFTDATKEIAYIDRISNVAMANAMVLHNGMTVAAAGDEGESMNHILELVCNDAIFLLRGKGGNISSASRTIYYTVVEFQPEVLNGAVQRGYNGTGSSPYNAGTVTINSVPAAYSFCNYTGMIATGVDGGTPNSEFGSMVLTNATTVTFTVGISPNGKSVLAGGFEVVQFYPPE